MSNHALFAGLRALALASALAGCRTATSSLCHDACACMSCQDDTLDACVESGAKSFDAAAAAGCTSLFEDAVSCAASELSCQSNLTAPSECKKELANLAICSSKLSVFGASACQLADAQIVMKLATCPKPPTALTDDGGPPPECTAAFGTNMLCQAAAVVRASCDCLGSGDAEKCTKDQLDSFSNDIHACN